MKKYYCQSCAYLYNPSEHNNVEFQDLPNSFTCPQCGASKNQFVLVHQFGEPDTKGEAQEKHVPVIESDENGVKVKVGAIPHPMEEAHFIQKIELYENGFSHPKSVVLKAGVEPVAFFEGISCSSSLKAIAHCNIHGIWESK